MDLKEEVILGEQLNSHWYYISKGRALLHLLRGLSLTSVLDVGAGSGVFARQLLDKKIVQTGVCVDPNYDDARLADRARDDLRFTRYTEAVDQDLILFMDVLEHVDDDLALLRSYTDRMPRDAHVLITVPAFQWLWSGHDEFLEHRRRYTLPEVEVLLHQAGLAPIKSRYFFGLLFPVVAAMRLIDRIRLRSRAVEAKSQLKLASPLMNKALVGTHDVERHTLFHGNRLFGLTVFCLARRS